MNASGSAIARNAGSSAAGVTSVVAGLTVANGAGGVHNSGTLTVSNCAVSGNTASDAGGGLRNLGTLTVVNSTVQPTVAEETGRHRGAMLDHGDSSAYQSSLRDASPSGCPPWAEAHGDPQSSLCEKTETGLDDPCEVPFPPPLFPSSKKYFHFAEGFGPETAH